MRGFVRAVTNHQSPIKALHQHQLTEDTLTSKIQLFCNASPSAAAMYAKRYLSGILIVSIFFEALIVTQAFTMQMASNLKHEFVTNKMCPFAQKAWIALEASDTPYDLKEVSLYGSGGKPSWFLKLNPAGTVPVLVDSRSDDVNVYPDSELILDYIKDFSTLHEQDKNIDEEKVQQWREIVSKKIIPIGKKAVLGRSESDLFALLKEIDSEIEGPYLCGDHITVADCAAFPFVWRIADEFGLERGSRLESWLKKCNETSCFKKTVQGSWWWWW